MFKILLNDMKESWMFSIYLAAIKFKFLINKVFELANFAEQFGPKNVVSNENFLASIRLHCLITWF